MTMRKGAALGVLAGQPDGEAFADQRAEREPLRMAPVDAAVIERRAAPFELPLELRVDGEAVGNAKQLVVQTAQLGLRDCGLEPGAGSPRTTPSSPSPPWPRPARPRASRC